MKNKGRVLSLGLLVVCFAIFAAGIYALKNASLNVSGTIGFTAHDCNILVYGKIDGAVTDPDDMSGEAKELYLVDYAGSGEFSQTEAFDFTGTLDLTFDANLWKESEGSYINAPKIYFNDSGDTAPDIVITLYLKNNSAYPVNVRVDDGISALEGVVEAKHTDLTRLENNVDEFSELKITLTLTDNSAEIDTSSKNFNPSLYFAKAKEQLPAPGNVTVDAENKTVTFDPVEGATGYEISYYKEGEESAEPVYKQQIDASSTSSVPLDFAPTESGNYVVKVRAYRVENEVNDYSAYSSVSEAINYIATTSARYFTFDGSAVTGVVEDVGLDEIIIPKTYDIDSEGNFIDGTKYTVDTIKALVVDPDYPYNSESGFKNYSGSIVLLDNIQSVQEYAFVNCNSIQKITIPDSVVSFGTYAFGISYFTGCSALKNVYYEGDFDQWCNINFANTRSNPCSYGASLYLNNRLIKEANFEGYTNIKQYIFSGCKSIETITLPDSVTSIGAGAFCDTNISEITTPKDVTIIEPETFESCYKLSSVTFNGKITEIRDSAFLECESLEHINLPDSLVNLGESAFSGAGLLEITIPKNVTKIQAFTFEVCLSLETVTFNGEVTEIGESAFFNCQSLAQIPSPENLQIIKDGAFSATALQNITGLEKLTEIGVGAFWGCESLEEVTLPETLTTIGEDAFSDCVSLTTVTLPKTLKYYSSDVFYNCDSITNVYYNGTLEQWLDIDFEDIGSTPCFNLELYTEEINGVTLYIGNEKLTKVDFRDFPTITNIKPYTLAGCKDITEIIFSDNITSMGDCAFIMTGITEITLPKNITELGVYEFMYCDKLKKIDMNECNVENFWSAFSYCTSVTQLIISRSLIDIGDLSENKPNIKIYCPGDYEEFDYFRTNSRDCENLMYYQISGASEIESAQHNWWYYDGDNIVDGTV